MYNLCDGMYLIYVDESGTPDCVAYIVNHHYKLNQNKDENMKKILEEGFEIIEQKMPCEKRYSKKIFP